MSKKSQRHARRWRKKEADNINRRCLRNDDSLTAQLHEMLRKQSADVTTGVDYSACTFVCYSACRLHVSPAFNREFAVDSMCWQILNKEVFMCSHFQASIFKPPRIFIRHKFKIRINARNIGHMHMFFGDKNWKAINFLLQKRNFTRTCLNILTTNNFCANFFNLNNQREF